MKVIQIGANKGYDDLTDLLKNKNVDLFVAIEPFFEHNKSLQECYSHLSNFFIENLIVSDVSEPCMKNIYYHEEDSLHANKYELASLNKDHSLKIRSQYSEKQIKERYLKCVSINHIMESYKVSDLDILFIDTEGYDDKIIRSIDFNKFKIKSIYYENLHIDVNSLRCFLESKQYFFEKNVTSMGWSDLATLKLN
jgi:FkbM family methyltransferase